MHLIFTLIRLDSIKLSSPLLISYLLLVIINIIYLYFANNIITPNTSIVNSTVTLLQGVIIVLFSYVFFLKTIHRARVLIILIKQQYLYLLFFFALGSIIFSLLGANYICKFFLNLYSLAPTNVIWLEIYLLLLSILPSIYLIFHSDLGLKNKNVFNYSFARGSYVFAILPAAFINFNSLDIEIDEQLFPYSEDSPFFRRGHLYSIGFHNYRGDFEEGVRDNLEAAKLAIASLTNIQLNNIFSPEKLQADTPHHFFNVPTSLIIEGLVNKPEVLATYNTKIFTSFSSNVTFNGWGLFINSSPFPSGRTYALFSLNQLELLTIVNSLDAYNCMPDTYKWLVHALFPDMVSSPFNIGYSTVYDFFQAELELNFIPSKPIGMNEAMHAINIELELANLRTSRLNNILQSYTNNISSASNLNQLPTVDQEEVATKVIQYLVNRKLVGYLQDLISRFS